MSEAEATAPIALEADVVRLTEVIFPAHANHYQTLFGGEALTMMARAAVIAAARHAGRNVVMASSEKIDFRSPVRVGEVVEVSARVTRAGRTSMTVWVDVVALPLSGGAPRPAIAGRFEMVAIDDEGVSAPLRMRETEPGGLPR